MRIGNRRLPRLGAIVFLLTTLATSRAALGAPCPSALRFDGDAAGSDVDFGWTGVAHDFPLIGAALTMRASCLPSGTPCTNCPLSGPVLNAAGYNQRCAGDTSIVCGSDAACGADAPCSFYLAPPQPIGVGGVSVCLVDEIGGSLTGTLNVPAGDFTSLAMPLSWEIFIGATLDRPCPRCVGDATLNDAVRGGTCDGGPRLNLACDGNAASPTPDFGVTSYDCPLNPLSSIGKLTVPSVPLSSRTGGQSVTLSAASPDCTAFGSTGQKCLCQTCGNPAGTPCFSNADCGGAVCGGRRCLPGGTNVGAPCSTPGGGDPTCGGGFCGVPGASTRPNACVDDTFTPTDESVCTDTAPFGDNEGECVAGPFDNYCAPPEEYRGCSVAADCPLTATCTLKLRECYEGSGLPNATTSVAGVPDPPVGSVAHPTLGALYCLGSASASSANVVAGFPGLGRLKLPGTLTLAQEIASQPVPPGGSVSTGTSPTGNDPVETTVTSPNPGPVAIIEQNNVSAPPSGFTFVNQQVDITAPNATASNPLVVVFTIDSSRLTGVTGATCGAKKGNIVVQKDGVPSPPGVGVCGNPAGPPNASPTSPCIAERLCLGGDAALSSDVRLTVWTDSASTWQFSVPEPMTATAVAGDKLLLKDNAVPTKRKLTLQLKDADLATAVPGSADDPTCAGSGGGAALDVFGTGGSSQYLGLALPCGNWTVIGDPADAKGYKYKDAHQLAGPCTSVVVKNRKVTPTKVVAGQVKAVCSGKTVASPLDYDLESGEGSIGVTFRMGSGLGYCAEFGGTIKKDDARTFQAQGAAPPGICPTQ